MPDTLTKDELLALAANVLDIEARAVDALKSRLNDDFVTACQLCMDTPGRPAHPHFSCIRQKPATVIWA